MKRKGSLILSLCFGYLAYLLVLGYTVQANVTSVFTQTINSGTLFVDIVDANFAAVANPSVAFSAVNFSFACQDSTATFGTNTERIYVKNPDVADGGWSVALAAATPTALWDSSGVDFDFNDAGGSGCTDDTDDDSFGGQMSVDPSGGTLLTGNCSTCTSANITKGGVYPFVEGTRNSITLLTGAAESDDIGDWYLTGVDVTQKIPAEQPAASDYAINLVLSITSL